MSAIYRVINPVVKGVLCSPIHGLMSHNTMLLRFSGRRSGRVFELPVSYAELDGTIYGFTALSGQWWRNFEGQGHASMRICGKVLDARVDVLLPSEVDLQDRFEAFLRKVPRDARAAGIKMEGNRPIRTDVASALQRLVGLRYRTERRVTG